MIGNLINKLEEVKISFSQWLMIFFSIVLVRNFLENFSGQSLDHRLTDIYTHFIHYPLAYLALFLSIIVILYLITKEDIVKILKICLVGLTVIWLPPILDIIFTWGRGWMVNYWLDGWKDFLFNFFTLLGKFRNPGATIGIRIEVVIILLGLALYTYLKTVSFKKSVFTLFFVYVAIFLCFNLPLFIVTFAELPHLKLEEINREAMSNFFEREASNSLIFSSRIGGINDGLVDSATNFGNIFNLEISAVYIIIIIILLLLILKFYKKENYLAILRNVRVLRLGHYFLMAAIGVYLGWQFREAWPFDTLYDYLALLLLFISVAFFWIGAVFQDDLADIKIDSISNIDRPLPQKMLNAQEAKTIVLISFIISLVSAFIAGYYIFIFILTAIAISYLYSTEPLRLKQFPILNSFLIALASLTVIMSGFFLAGGTFKLNQFPVRVAIIVLLTLTMAFGTKDIKDIEGDKKAGIKTIPVIFGEDRGKKILGVMSFIAFLIIPIVFWRIEILVLSIIFGSIIYYLINKKKYQEKYIFIAYFFYVLLLSPFITRAIIFN